VAKGRPSPWWEKVNKGNKEAGLRYGFRSGLEERNAKLIESLGQPVIYEALKVRYSVPLSFHIYTPDFELANGIIVETKGVWDAKDRAKMLLVKAQHPELDIRMVFTRSAAPIGKGSKTTMADFCRKNGIKFADKLIPREWLLEKGPDRKPQEVLAR
jgi:hypothetical protein